MSNTPEQNKSTLQIIASWFVKPGEKAEDLTPSELNQRAIEANEDAQQFDVIVSKMIESFNAEVTKANEVYAAQLKTETDLIIGEFRTQIAGFEKQLSEKSEGVTSEEVDSKIEAAKVEIGNEINTIKLSKGISAANGDPKIIQTHEQVKKAPQTRVLGTYPEE